MARSMTAFARHATEGEWGSAVWELRSVNHRYLDIYLRLPEELRALDSRIRERIGASIRRGKVEANLRFQPQGNTIEIQVDAVLAGELAKASREVDQLLYNPAPVSSMDLLGWPGVLQVSPPDLDLIGGQVLSLLDSALEDLVATRDREGTRITAFLAERIESMAPHLETVRGLIPTLVEDTRRRLYRKLEDLRSEVDENRLEQELVLFAQRVDVSEELDRLGTHMDEVRRVLNQTRPIGRRLDFLMQELNREANTLSSKSVNAEVTRAAVELKVAIEQMREQIQNLE